MYVFAALRGARGSFLHVWLLFVLFYDYYCLFGFCSFCKCNFSLCKDGALGYIVVVYNLERFPYLGYAVVCCQAVMFFMPQ